MNLPTWVVEKKESVHIFLHVVPNAKKSECIGILSETQRLKVKIAAPAHDQLANEELISFFSKILNTSKKSLSIVKGANSRKKELCCIGFTIDEIKLRLGCQIS